MKAYVLPFALYLVLTQIAAAFPEYYAWLYATVVLAVGSVTVGLLRGQRAFRVHPHVIWGALVGLGGIALWIGLCRLNLEEQLSAHLPSLLRPQKRVAFNPFENIKNPVGCWAFVALRLAGLVALVPVAEELFWRGFLLRWLISSDWQNQKLGQFTPLSFAAVTLLFTLVHPEWLAAAVYCALLNVLMYWKKDLWICIVAHGVSNLVLAVYILSTGTWELW